MNDTIADLTRRALAAEDAKIEAALRAAAAAGCGIKINRTPAAYEFRDDRYSCTSTFTVEVCPDVPVGEIHETRQARRIDDADVAAGERHAMVDDLGQVFYPDGPEDAAEFAEFHGARYRHAAGADWS